MNSKYNPTRKISNHQSEPFSAFLSVPRDKSPSSSRDSCWSSSPGCQQHHNNLSVHTTISHLTLPSILWGGGLVDQREASPQLSVWFVLWPNGVEMHGRQTNIQILHFTRQILQV